MKSKYQKYYDGLKDKNFSTFTSKYSTAISTVKTKINSVSTSISSNSNSWTEKGVTAIQQTIIPSVLQGVTSVEYGLTALNEAVSKCSSLVSKLAELDSACKMYDSAKDEDKATYQSKINTLESEADQIISAINAITIQGVTDDSSQTTTTTTTGADQSTSLTSDLAAKKAAFLGDVDDPTQYTKASNYKTKRKIMTAFDNTTGEILTEHSTINMKPGETRIITVKLPTDTGMIGELRRTTADGDGAYRSGKILTGKSDVNPDPNVVDYVNYQPQVNHWPKNVDLHTNHYDWIITANADGTVRISQTCEYTTKDEPNWYAKAMFVLNVNVSS